MKPWLILISLFFIVTAACEDTNLDLAASAGMDAIKAATLSDSQVKTLAMRASKESDARHRVAPPGNAHARRLERIAGKSFSSDGYTFDERHPEPAFSPDNNCENLGCEDPRLTLMDGECLMTYTAYRNTPMNAFQVSLTQIHLDDFLSYNWNWGERHLPFDGIHNKNAVIFPKKIREVLCDIHHADVFVHDNHPARSHHRAGFRQAVEIHR